MWGPIQWRHQKHLSLQQPPQKLPVWEIRYSWGICSFWSRYTSRYWYVDSDAKPNDTATIEYYSIWSQNAVCRFRQTSSTNESYIFCNREEPCQGKFLYGICNEWRQANVWDDGCTIVSGAHYWVATGCAGLPPIVWVMGFPLNCLLVKQIIWDIALNRTVHFKMTKQFWVKNML